MQVRPMTTSYLDLRSRQMRTPCVDHQRYVVARGSDAVPDGRQKGLCALDHTPAAQYYRHTLITHHKHGRSSQISTSLQNHNNID